MSHRWADLLIGSSAAVLGAFATVSMLDHGILPSRWWAYLLVCVAPAIAASIRPRRVSDLVILAAGALFATALFYRVGVQPHIVSELANDLDWVIMLCLMAGAMCVAGISTLVLRSGPSTPANVT